MIARSQCRRPIHTARHGVSTGARPARPSAGSELAWSRSGAEAARRRRPDTLSQVFRHQCERAFISGEVTLARHALPMHAAATASPSPGVHLVRHRRSGCRGICNKIARVGAYTATRSPGMSRNLQQNPRDVASGATSCDERTRGIDEQTRGIDDRTRVFDERTQRFDERTRGPGPVIPGIWTACRRRPNPKSANCPTNPRALTWRAIQAIIPKSVRSSRTRWPRPARRCSSRRGPRGGG